MLELTSFRECINITCLSISLFSLHVDNWCIMIGVSSVFLYYHSSCLISWCFFSFCLCPHINSLSCCTCSDELQYLLTASVWTLTSYLIWFTWTFLVLFKQTVLLHLPACLSLCSTFVSNLPGVTVLYITVVCLIYYL